MLIMQPPTHSTSLKKDTIGRFVWKHWCAIETEVIICTGNQQTRIQESGGAVGQDTLNKRIPKQGKDHEMLSTECIFGPIHLPETLDLLLNNP